MLREKKSKGSILTYEPVNKRLSIISGELFHFNNEIKQFELDLNPYGDPEPVPIYNLQYQNNKLKFEIVDNSDKIEYLITSSYKSDHVIYKMMIDIINNSNFSYNENEKDKVIIEFERSKLKTIEIIRYRGIQRDNSLKIIFRDEGNFIIKYPFERLELQSMYIKDNSIFCQTANELIEWQFLVQPFIYGYIYEIINISLSATNK